MTVETERRVHTDKFSAETKDGLLRFTASIIKSKERTLRDFEEQGINFTNVFLEPEQRDIIFSVRSRPTEIAYLPKSLFFFSNLRHDSYSDQIKMLEILRADLNEAGIRDIDVIFPSVADCIEIFEAELNFRSPANIFGKRNGYPLSRTSTELDPTSTVIIGLDDLDSLDIRSELELDKVGSIDHLYGIPDLRLRGIHIDNCPKDSNKYSGLYVMPIIVPSI